MSKLTEALATPPTRSGTCKLCMLLDGHKDRREIDAALSNQRWPHAALSRVLTDNDIPVGETAVKNHRLRCMKPKAK